MSAVVGGAESGSAFAPGAAQVRHRTFALTQRPLSVRWNVRFATLALILIASVLLVGNQHAMKTAAYMLKRAEMSYRQLGAYQQLSIDTLEYIASDGPSATKPRLAVESELRALYNLVTAEADLVRENGVDEDNLEERRRIEQIQAIVADMVAARRNGDTGIERYRSKLKPLLEQAVTGEKTETALVERSMRRMQETMLWLGWLAIVAQTAMAALVLWIVERAVLGPLKRLVNDIREFGRGLMTHRVDILRHDEFGLLGQHVNRMARQIDRRSSALRHMNDALEATVADRTRDLKDRNEELQEIDDSRRRFFVDVSHELRTPLTAIVGEAELALRDAKMATEINRQSLASILANSIYLNRRIDDLMSLARSTSGRLDVEMAAVDLNLIGVEATTEIGSLAKINQVEVRFEPLLREVVVEGDRKRLRQCLMTLLDNAVKFSPPAAIVEIRLEIVDDGNKARLSVIDSGRGIAADDLAVIFERFYQTEVGRRRGGTGLGLAIARRIVEAHHGAIRAVNAETGGTAMIIELPLQQSETA